jgi:arylsulfatase A-like enzyme
MLPTNHGFDEFYGNLYHLNAEEEPEMYDYYPEEDFGTFIETIKPRGVIHSFATDVDDRPCSRAGARSGGRRSRIPARSQRADADVRRRFAERARASSRKQRTPTSRSSCG